MTYSDLYWNTTPFLSIDTETTGFGRDDRICEIAIVVAQGTRVLDVFHTLVDPERWISEGAQAVHGIKNEDVEGKPKFHEIKDKVLSYLRRDMPWVAHQLSFDARMLSYVIPPEEWPHGVPTLCSMEYAKKHHPSLKLRRGHKLLDVAGALQINYDPAAAHNALNDAEILARIVPEMMRDRLISQHYTKLSHEWLK
jgi:DNA polymerase-3 subunit epsilon